MDLLEFRERVEDAWGFDTAHSPSGSDPASGQCAVTALLLQNHFGGELMAGYAVLPDGSRVRHYWNYVNGLDVDLTWRQFPYRSRIEDAVVASRSKALANEDTRRRYEILKGRFAETSVAVPA